MRFDSAAILNGSNAARVRAWKHLRALQLGNVFGIQFVQLRTGMLGFALWFVAAAASPCLLPLGQH